MRRHPETPAEPEVDLLAFADRAVALGVDAATFAPLRAAAQAIEDADPELADLVRNPASIRDRLAREVDEGTLTIAEAREQITAGAARVAADRELVAVLNDVHARRRRRALEIAGAIDWLGLVTPLGIDAAAKVVELAEKLPAGLDDAAAVRGSDAQRKAWLSFGATVGAWRGAVNLLVDLRWSGLSPFAPLGPDVRDRVAGEEWYWTAESVLELRQRELGRSEGLASLLELVHDDLVPACPTPTELHERFLQRQALRDVSRPDLVGARLVPGADVPSRAPAAA